MADSSMGLHEAREELTPATLDRHRGIVSLMEELEAIDWYQQRIDAAGDPELAAVLAHNRDEETEHAAMSPSAAGTCASTLTEGSIVAIEEEVEGGGGGGAATGALGTAACGASDEPPAPRAGARRRGRLGRYRARRRAARWRHFLTACKLTGFSGPHGWDHSALGLARRPVRRRPRGGRREPHPPRPAAGRAADALHAESLRGRRCRAGRPRRGLGPGGRRGAPRRPGRGPAGVQRLRGGRRAGIVQTSPHDAVQINTDYDRYPNYVAKAVETLKRAGVAGPTRWPSGPAATRA